MEKIKLNIIALAHSESQPSSYVVILKEEEGERRLPVVIGSYEAQAIATAAEGIKPNRPLTHDLFYSTLQTFSIQLEEVVISALRNGVFYATLVCSTVDGKITELDSRTSDALALAIRFGCPVFTYPLIMDEAGVVWENPPARESTPPRPKTMASYSDEELATMLEEALEEENYERAAQIRDEMDRRKHN